MRRERRALDQPSAKAVKVGLVGLLKVHAETDHKPLLDLTLLDQAPITVVEQINRTGWCL